MTETLLKDFTPDVKDRDNFSSVLYLNLPIYLFIYSFLFLMLYLRV